MACISHLSVWSQLFLLITLTLQAHGVEHLDESIPQDADPVAAAKTARRNIANFKKQTQLMIAAWQEACKIDKVCSQANQTILTEVYSYYTEPMDCKGNTAFFQIAPAFIAHMTTEGFDASKAGYELKDVLAKECFAHDTTVMSAGDLKYGTQNVVEHFGVEPGSGGRIVFVQASFDIGWQGKPLRLTSTYKYAFDDDGKIQSWEGRYDPIETYSAILASKAEFCAPGATSDTLVLAEGNVREAAKAYQWPTLLIALAGIPFGIALDRFASCFMVRSTAGSSGSLSASLINPEC